MNSAFHARRLRGRRQTDQAAQILVIERLRHQIGVDQQSLPAAVDVEPARKIAVTDLAGELIERPQRVVVL